MIIDQANASVEACTAAPELSVVSVARMMSELYAAGYVLARRVDVESHFDAEFQRTMDGE